MNLKFRFFIIFLCVSAHEVVGREHRHPNRVINTPKRFNKTRPLQAGSRAGCSFNLSTDSPQHPPHIVSGGKIVNPVLQGTSRVITLDANQQVTVACEGTNNYLQATGVQINTATCVSGSSLQIGSQSYTYSGLGCVSQPKETLKETGTCGPNSAGVKVEIGWQVGTTFINQITICHNRAAANNYYAIDTVIGKSIDADDSANTRPSFRKGSYFTGIDVDGGYSQTGQLAIVSNIVGSSTLGSQYVDVGKSYYFARGHLSPDGDFIDAASQDATYYYINVLPQWQSFNNGNWKALELAVRDLAASRDHDFVTYTGGFGTLTLADVNGVQKPIYLKFDANNNGLIPAPKYYWKVVHDTATNTATAFVGINNPHLGSVSAGDVICQDVCSQISWVTWNRRSISSGYMYCCTVASLHSAISYAPNLDLPLLT